jgi:hypothetical protein
MALTYTIQRLETCIDENSDSGDTIKYVSFQVYDDVMKTNFYIDKQLAIVDGKKDEVYLKEAQALCQTEIAAWQESEKNKNKIWNPDSGKIE